MSGSNAPRIAVLTVNPGIDRTMYFDHPLERGEVNRASSTNLNQGCKGANAVIIMKRQGADVTYFTFSGGPFGALYESFLADAGVPTVCVNTACGVRLNVKLCDGEGTFTECNQSGGPVTAKEQEVMLAALRNAQYDCLYLAGSLPRGLSTDFYATCTALAHEKGATVVADCDGAVLAETLKASPDLVKPNRSEFETLIGTDGTLTQKIEIFKKRYPNTTLLLSLGKDGAVLVSDTAQWHAHALPVPVRGTVAAGDTLLASFTVARQHGKDIKEALAIATAASAAKIQLHGTDLPTAAQMAERKDEVVVAEFKE